MHVYMYVCMYVSDQSDSLTSAMRRASRNIASVVESTTFCSNRKQARKFIDCATSGCSSSFTVVTNDQYNEFDGMHLLMHI